LIWDQKRKERKGKEGGGFLFIISLCLSLFHLCLNTSGDVNKTFDLRLAEEATALIHQVSRDAVRARAEEKEKRMMRRSFKK